MIASSRRAQIKERQTQAHMTWANSMAGDRERNRWATTYADDVELLMYELERTETELDAMTRDRNSYRASYNAERALRKREREGARGRFGRWLGL